MKFQFVETTQAVQQLVGRLPLEDRASPSLYLDLEGNDLSRHGTLSLLTMLIEDTVYLVDISSLGHAAFTVEDHGGRSLRSVLESRNPSKVFFDIRNDSDALFSLFGIRVAGIIDLQLMELASRSSSKRCVNGLAKCIEQDAGLDYTDRMVWKHNKEIGRTMFAPERGGSYAVFDARPLSDEMKKYCVQDVSYMPVLFKAYAQKLCNAWWTKIDEETESRVVLSQSRTYNGKGRHMALGPPSWKTWHPSIAELRHCSRWRHSNDTIEQAVPRPTSETATPSAEQSTVVGGVAGTPM